MSKKLKLTPWFPSDVKPASVGFYERKYSSSDAGQQSYDLDYWSGAGWHYGNGKIKRPRDRALIQCREWRGLAVKP